MSIATQLTIKVNEETKQKVAAAALACGKTQAEIVRIAVDEFVGRHAGELSTGINDARRALAAGQSEAVAHLLGVSAEDVRRVGGS